VEKDEAADPIEVGSLGANAAAFDSKMPLDAVQEFGGCAGVGSSATREKPAEAAARGRERVRAVARTTWRCYQP
jgi:hypothetical protein